MIPVIAALPLLFARPANVQAVTVEPPAGWSRAEVDGNVELSAPDTPAGGLCKIVFFPPVEAKDVRGWFDQRWSAFKAPYSDVQEFPVSASRSPNGFDGILAGASMNAGGGRFLYVTFFAASADGRVQSILYLTDDQPTYMRHQQEVGAVFGSLHFRPRDKQPAAVASLPAWKTVAPGPAANPAPTAVSSNPFAARPDPGPGSIVGKWGDMSASAIGFVNEATGQWMDPTGAGQTWEFHADGTYAHAGILSSAVLSCSTKFFVYDEGTYQVKGSTVVMKQKYAREKNVDTCYGGGYDKKLPPETVTMPFRFGRQVDAAIGLNQLVLILTDPKAGDQEFPRQ